MLARGLDQRGLARAASLSEGTVSKVLALGHASPPTLAALARALAATPELPLVRAMLSPDPGDESAARVPTPAAVEEEGDEAAQLQPPE